MSEENKDAIRVARETVVLNEESGKKIDRWLEQIATRRVRLSKKEFLNWYIEKSAENLSNADLNAIVERYYDEEAFLRRLLKEVKQAKKDGSPGNLEVVVRQKKVETKKEVSTLDGNEAEFKSEIES